MDGDSSLYAKCSGLSTTTTLESRHRAGGNNLGLSSTISSSRHSGKGRHFRSRDLRVQDLGISHLATCNYYNQNLSAIATIFLRVFQSLTTIIWHDRGILIAPNHSHCARRPFGESHWAENVYAAQARRSGLWCHGNGNILSFIGHGELDTGIVEENVKNVRGKRLEKRIHQKYLLVCMKK